MAGNASNKYNEAKENEQKELNNSLEFIDINTNKVPRIQVLKYSERTETTMKITAMATDEDGENLTYTLFVGTSKENLVEQTEVKENIKQGTEVIWTVPAEKDRTYYYKITVKDRYTVIESSVKQTNNAPILEKVEIEANLEQATRNNWVKVTAMATDIENDKLTYTLKMWKKTEDESEENLITQMPTKTEVKTNITAGKDVEIRINELDEYQEYIYRVDVSDENNMTIGEKDLVKTLCSGIEDACSHSVCLICERNTEVILNRILQSLEYLDFSRIGMTIIVHLEFTRRGEQQNSIPQDYVVLVGGTVYVSNAAFVIGKCGCLGWWRAAVTHTCGKCNGVQPECEVHGVSSIHRHCACGNEKEHI